MLSILRLVIKTRFWDLSENFNGILNKEQSLQCSAEYGIQMSKKSSTVHHGFSLLCFRELLKQRLVKDS